MKIKLATAAMLVLFSPSACFAGPFGLDAGMTRDAVVQRIGKSAIVKESPDGVVFNTAPTPNDHFSTYRCFFAKNGKLAAVIATSSPVVIPLSEGFLSTYEFLKIDLEDKYGKASDGRAYKASKEKWEAGIRTKQAVAIALWDGHGNDKLYQSHLTGIALSVQPVDEERSVLTLAYNFRVSEEPGL